MQSKLRKTVFVFLATMCLTVVSIPVSATNVTSDFPENVVVPKYIALDELFASLTISATGNANCTGKALLTSGYTGVLTMVLQQSTNGRDWSEVETWTGSGIGRISLNKSIFVTSGYQYRVLVTVEITTSNGVFVEDSTEYSAIAKY